MKNKFICLKISKIHFFILGIFSITIIYFIGEKVYHDTKKSEQNITKEITENIEKDNIDENEEKLYETNVVEIPGQTETNMISEEEHIIGNTIELEAYKTMPQEIEGFKVVGKIQIPKINIEAYILSETNKNTLKASVTKLCGPKINEVGNFCIAGHNYKKFFGNIKDLEIKDTIILTDTYDRSITYEVYDTYQSLPQDVNCLNQDTGGDREVTLITCTKGALKRIIVKAVEVYD